MKDEGKEAECSFYLFTPLPFYLKKIMPNDKKAYAQREKFHFSILALSGAHAPALPKGEPF